MAATVTQDGKWYSVKGTEADVLAYLDDNNFTGSDVRGFLYDGTDYVVLVKRGA